MTLLSNILALVALVTVIHYGTACAQTDSPEPPVAVPDNSCFVLQEDANFDFGDVDQNETVEHTFIFKNNCDRIIHVDKAQASCGCTAAVLSEHDIPPGGEAKIHVKFTPPRMSNGKVTKVVTVYVEGDSRPHTQIRFSANVKNDLDLEPRNISLRGAVVGDPIEGQATLRNTSAAPIVINEMQVSMYTYADTSSAGTRGAVPIQLKEVEVTPQNFTLNPGEGKMITVKLVPEYKGQINGSVRFKSDKAETWLQVYGVARDKNEGEIRQ